MKRAPLHCIAALALTGTGCVTTHVTSLATTPDGQLVTATGLRMRAAGVVAWIEKNLEWHCQRGPDERLTCVEHPLDLPPP